MIKVLFLINTLGKGGAEKILLETVKNLDKKKYDVYVKALYNKGIYINEMKEHCKYSFILDTYTSKEKVNNLIYSLFLRLIKIIPAKKLYNYFIKSNIKYDFEIAFLEGGPTKIISGSDSKSRKYAWVHVEPILQPDSEKAYLSVKQEKKVYNTFDSIFCVSSEVKQSFEKKYEVNSEKVNVLLNIIDEKKIIKKSNIKNNHYKIDFNENDFNICSLGRLAKQKNYKMLINSFSKLLESKKNIHLYILGDGDEKEALNKLIKDLNVEDYVTLVGFIENPYPFMKKCDLYVCSSIAEGYSTAITEALLVNLPILTTDCGGMHDLIGESEYGILIKENSVQAFYSELLRLINDSNYYNFYKKKSVERSKMFDMNERIKDFESKVFGKR